MILIFRLAALVSFGLSVLQYFVVENGLKTWLSICVLALLIALFAFSGMLNEVYMSRKRYTKPFINVFIIGLMIIGFAFFGGHLLEAEMKEYLYMAERIAWILIMFLCLIANWHSFIKPLWKITKEISIPFVSSFTITLPWLMTVVCLIGYGITPFINFTYHEWTLTAFFAALGLSHFAGGWFLKLISNRANKNK